MKAELDLLCSNKSIEIIAPSSSTGMFFSFLGQILSKSVTLTSLDFFDLTDLMSGN